MNIKIRKATAGDATTIAEILTDATQYKAQHGDSSWGSTAYVAEEVRLFLDDAYLIYLENELAGTVTLQWEDRLWGEQPPNAGYIHKLAVKQRFRGLKIGEQVVLWALSKVKERNCEFLRLDCLTSNSKLCQYYEKQGFLQVGSAEVRGNEAALYEKKVHG